MSERLSDFLPPKPEGDHPAGWRPFVEYGSDGGFIVTQPRPAAGAELSSEDMDRIITDEGLTPAAWTVTSYRRSKWQKYDGDWLEAFRVVFAPTSRVGADMPDLDDLHKGVQRVKRPKPPKEPKDGITVVGVLADLQVSKVSTRGGTPELLARVEASRLAWVEYLRKVRPAEIILCDAGDPIENFESTGSQDRTNDLSLTGQLRLWRRIFWMWVETAASMAPSVKVVAVPSNHGAVRRGKAKMGPPCDDYGIETLAQLKDIAAVNPALYSHVSFHPPRTQYDEAVVIKAVGGHVLGVVHGHQVSNAEGIHKWWSGQSHGRTEVGYADTLVYGHFHNLRITGSGDDRFAICAPTSDSGSDWFRNLTGTESAPGVLTFTLTPDGWNGLAVV